MRAVITVIGKDNVGILHKVSGVCAKYEANVLEVTQSVLQDMFAMIMMVDITGLVHPHNARRYFQRNASYLIIVSNN